MSASSISPFVFISYSREDAAFVIRLRTDLQAQGISVWIDTEGIQAGAPDWEQALRDAIQAAHAVLYIASPSARASRYVKDELRIADYYQRAIFPIWVRGNHWMEATPIGLGGAQFIDARGEHYQRGLSDIVQAIHRVFNQGTALLSKNLSPDFKPRNPYKGLHAFQLEDAHDFFGRTRLTHELLQAVQQMLTIKLQSEESTRLLAVIGASGSGKSSVVMAGLLFQLQQGGLSGSRDWLYLDPVLPGKHPLQALTSTLSRHMPARSPIDISKDLKDESTRGLHLLLAALVKKPDTKVVLFIDQFEELFIYTHSDERQLFLDILVTAITEPAGPIIAVLTLRADFYDRLLQHSEIGRLIDAHHIVAFPMEINDFREVIERPARLPDVQLTFETDLIGDLLFDVRDQSGALPLLQFTLDQLFQEREGYLLTRRAYHQNLGSIKGALAKHAENTFQSLPTENHKRLARALFLRLIDAGTLDQGATKRRTLRSELILTDSNETAILQEVTQTFITARLLTTKTMAGAVEAIEVSHEALISQWDRLCDWLGKSYEDIRLRKRLSEDVDTWLQTGSPADRLYRDTQLAEAQDWRTRNIPSLSEEIFLQKSIAEQEREEAEEKQQQRQYTRRTILVGIGGVTMATIIAVPLSRYFFASSPPPPPKITVDRKISYTSYNAPVSSVCWSPDGQYIVSASYDRTVQILRVSIDNSAITMVQTYEGHKDAVFTANWSPDSKRIVSASLDKTVQIWETAPYGKSFDTHVTDNTCNVSWSPNSKYIVSANVSQKLQLWSVPSGIPEQPSQESISKSVSWSPDGNYIASISAKGYYVQVWDASNITLVRTYDASATGNVSWSPDSKRIASISLDKTVQVWDTLSGTLVYTYTGHTDFVECVSWSPTGKHIASGGYDKTVQVWDALSGTLIYTYTGHTDFVQCVSWSIDEKRIASTSTSGTMQVWDALSGRVIQTSEGYTEAGWSPDGKYLASKGIDKMIHIWESLPYIYKDHTNYVYSASWSPDGKYIASGGLDKTVHIWRASNGTLVYKYLGHSDAVVSANWSPDSKYIVSASWDNTVQIWEALSGRNIQIYKGHSHPQEFFSMQGASWSPNGTYIASAGGNKTVQVWEALSGMLIQTYTDHTLGVGSANWSPNGKYIAYGDGNTTVQVWEALSGKHIQTYRGHNSIISSINWSPNGKYIVSAGADKTVQVWSVQIS